MKIAYADPVYLGQSHRYPEHPNASDWDNLQTHINLIDELEDNYDGWAMSASVNSLREILPYCPDDARIMVWVKPFAAFKRNVNPAYAWEPIIIAGGRGRTNKNTYMRDWVAEPITLKKGMVGAKPRRVMFWLFDVLNMQPGDEFVDLFPGGGGCAAAWEEYRDNYPEFASHINRVKTTWEKGKGVDRGVG